MAKAGIPEVRVIMHMNERLGREVTALDNVTHAKGKGSMDGVAFPDYMYLTTSNIPPVPLNVDS